MSWLRDLPIRRKLTLTIVATCAIALLLTASILILLDTIDVRRTLVRDMTVMADVIARNSEAAVAFGDPDAAARTLRALEWEPHVAAAGVYDKQGNRFAEYVRADHSRGLPTSPSADGHHFEAGALTLFRPIALDRKRIGTIYLEAPLKRLHDRIQHLAAVAALILASSMLVAVAVSRRLQTSITGPLIALTMTSREITKRDDFSVRAVLGGKDETGELTRAFNQMLDALAERRRAFAELNEQLERRVRDRTEQLERANQELESFSYSVSHDLRAPLRAVDGYARLLEEDYAAALDDDGRRLLSVVRDEARRMGVLIDDLLSFSRLSRQPLRPTRLDLVAMADDILRELRRVHPERTIELVANDVPFAFGDLSTMRQVLANLLSNAVKYAKPEGVIRIEMTGSRNGTRHIYSIRDNGVGFDMRYVDKIFGVFQRLHGDEFEGTGVGLAIVERVIARHGGDVRAEGAAGEGACFTFTLPSEQEEKGLYA